MILTCAHCGTKFDRPPSNVKTDRSACSKKCSHHLRTRSVEEIFHRDVRKSSDPDACWIWKSAPSMRYCQIWDGKKRRREGEHRVAYQLYIGPIPDGMFVCHTCDTPRCCNPKHLFLGTPADNMADKMTKGRHVPGRTPGGKCSWAKLTETDVAIIRSSPDISATEFAARYGVCRQTIYDVRNRRKWKYLP